MKKKKAGAKRTDELSEEELASVAGGVVASPHTASLSDTIAIAAKNLDTTKAALSGLSAEVAEISGGNTKTPLPPKGG